MPDMTTYLTLTDVADRLSVNPKTVRRWIASGRLPAYRLPGGHYRIDATAVDLLLEGAYVRAAGDQVVA